MTTAPDIEQLQTGVRNLDAILGGGLPTGSVVVLAGPPGSGKTILAQQFCFHHASAEKRVLYFNTLSEPTAKTLRYLRPFSFFDPAKLDRAVQFVDLGKLLREDGLAKTAGLIMEQLKKVKPAVVVIDSFKVFDDLAKSAEELRKFGYEIGVHLMAWEATALLLGEYGPDDYHRNPLFSVVDGLISVTQREQSGEQQRFLQIVKLRGTHHSTDEHPFVITRGGIEVYAPRVTIQREIGAESAQESRLKTGVSKLDQLLGDGIPRGSSLLLAGVAGTGKTILLLEFLFRGALAGEKGIMFSFEETEARLRATARGVGWDLDREIERGMIEIVFIPQPSIVVEQHLLMMRERVERMGARRVGVDSVSVFLHKVKDPQIAREKTFQLASIIQNTGAVGFFATDIPYGSTQVSRFGVEETVVDGVILLSSTEEGHERQRYIEIYKLRNTAHMRGRHSMTIGRGGVSVFPRYSAEVSSDGPPPPIESQKRVPMGIPKLDEMLGGGLLARSLTLVSGSAGAGKSVLAAQFILEGAARGEPGLYATLEEAPEQVLESAGTLGLPLREAVQKGTIEVLYLAREQVRAGQFLAVLTDRIRERKVRRLVLDSVTHMLTGEVPPDELRRILYALANRFKRLNVTSLLTLELPHLASGDSATDRHLSPVADNLLLLQYSRARGELEPTLTIVKTRGSRHDRGTYFYDLARGGIRIADRVPPATAHAAKAASTREKGRRRGVK